MKILITGGGGFLARGMVEPFETRDGYSLRLLDVCDFPNRHEVIVGDVRNYNAVLQAAKGMDAIIIAHMAPRGENNMHYSTPEMPFDINLKGTANVLHAAVVCGIKRIVLISSDAAISAYKREEQNHTLSPKSSTGYYGMTKACQEMLAEQFSRGHQMQVSVLRVGYILDGKQNVDKYGKSVVERNYADTDARDIGEVARRCLERTEQTYEVLHVMSTTESLMRWDVQHTCDRLGWTPEHDFSWLSAPSSM